ncbi:uncharacterized protein LOC110807606 [Carica papaya]|uniref:uncharacterized protein LOC110807606 n=1 Tax=Carica papaya TaxID=3649 RepID=UPI000B8D18FB|nr:uncharacterized protein LOC110807606 [Carica papaya]
MASTSFSRSSPPLIATVMMIVIVTGSFARELRPSDHGLEYQGAPPEGLKSPEMLSFFGTSSGSSTSETDDMALPRAMNSSSSHDSWWWGRGRRGGNGGENDRVRQVLVVTSLVCGVTGGILLGASALICLLRYQKEKPPSPSSLSPSCMIDNGK